MADDPTDATRRAIERERALIRRLVAGTPPPSPALRRGAEALRDLSRWLVASDPGEEALATLAGELEALVGRAGAGAPAPRTRFATPPPEPAALNPRGTHPLLGAVSPVAPPIALRLEADRVVGEVTFDLRFEGNIGWVHGGYVAAGFDIIAVEAARLSGRAGPTGTLRVRFVAPTPVGVPLRYEGWFLRAEGRKLFVAARLVCAEDGRLTAEADAIAITPPG